MGACFNSLKFKASDAKILKDSFEKVQEEYCSNHGSDSYAGHIGIVRGIEVSNKIFKDEDSAYNYVNSNAQKWGCAIAVKVGDFSKVFPVTATEKKELTKEQELQSKYSNWDKDLIMRVKQAKSTQRGCKKCGSKISVKYVNSINCPVCGDNHFVTTDTDNKAFQTLKAKLKEQTSKVKEMSKKYEEKNKSNYWYVGAWCAE